MTGANELLARAVATTANYRAAVERGDVDGFLATLAPGAVLHSPITMLTDFRGHDELRELHGSVERGGHPRGSRSPLIVVDASALTDFLLGRPDASDAVRRALDGREHEPLRAAELIEPETLNALRRLAARGSITTRRTSPSPRRSATRSCLPPTKAWPNAPAARWGMIACSRHGSPSARGCYRVATLR